MTREGFLMPGDEPAAEYGRNPALLVICQVIRDAVVKSANKPVRATLRPDNFMIRMNLPLDDFTQFPEFE